MEGVWNQSWDETVEREEMGVGEGIENGEVETAAEAGVMVVPEERNGPRVEPIVAEAPQLNIPQVGEEGPVSALMIQLAQITTRIAGLERTMQAANSVAPSDADKIEPVVTSTPTAVNTNISSKASPLKARDIKTLELSQLQDLDATARLQMFFEAVEQCTQDSDLRLKIAITQMDVKLSVMVHNARQQTRIRTWGDLKQFLKSEFEVKFDFFQAWHQQAGQRYSWQENPHAFVQNFKCDFSSIEGNFAHQALPNRDKIIKRKLLQGFPKVNQDFLSAFVDDSIPLDQFLVHVQQQRTMLQQSSPEYAVRANQASPSEFPKLNSSKITKPSFTSPYCFFCKSSSHEFKNCRSKPPPGCCFDCLRPNCRRGNRDCPGRSYQRRPEERASNWRQTPPVSTKSPTPMRQNTPSGSESA